MNEHTFAHLQASLCEKCIVCSHEDLRDRCRLNKIQIIGNFHQHPLMRQNILGLPTTTCNAHHTLPRFPGMHQWSDCIDFTSEFQARSIGRRTRRGRIMSRTLRQIGTLTPRGQSSEINVYTPVSLRAR